MAITPSEHFLEWLEARSPFLAWTVLYCVMIPAMAIGTALVVFLIVVAQIMAVLLAGVVAIVILLAGARYLGVEFPPEPASPTATRPSN